MAKAATLMRRQSHVAAALLWAALTAIWAGAAETPAAAALPDLSRASWLWAPKRGVRECYFRRTFDLLTEPINASVLITADNCYELYVNGGLVGRDAGAAKVFWSSVEKYDIASRLVAGRNVIAVHAQMLGGSAGLVAAVRIEATGGDLQIYTDPAWSVTLEPGEGWTKPGYDDSRWLTPKVVGLMGVRPWGKLRYPGPVSPAHEVRRDVGKFETPGPGFRWPAGVVFVQGKQIPRGVHFPLHCPALNRPILQRAYPENDVPAPSVVGHRLCALVPAKPDGRLRVLQDAGKGTLGSPSVSYDGQVVYFSMAPEGKGFYHIYRVPARGGVARALTDGPFHDYDPEPLPDGRIVFSSTRIGSREEYHGNLASSLFVMDPDGANIRPLTHHIVADREPRVTANGSLVFVRSDNFLERAKVETQIHHVRPDGTGGVVLFGNDRGAIGQNRTFGTEGPIRPGLLRQDGFGSPAALPDGRVAAISRRGLVLSGSARAGAGRVKPSVAVFDVSSMPDGRLLCTGLSLRSLGVIDMDSGRVTRLLGTQEGDMHSVVYLGPRPKPAGVAGLVRTRDEGRLDATGYLYCQSVFNTKQSKADLSRIKAVRVYEGRPLAVRPVRHVYAHIGVEAVELGTVPLAANGSFYVRVPADRALALQAVDGEGRAVISELSWIYVRPGEQRSCVGCHSARAQCPATFADQAARTRPMDLLGQGRPHRYRGNNAELGGVLNLQFDRMREAAAIDLYTQAPVAGSGGAAPLPPGRPGLVARLCAELSGADVALRISAARRLAVLRDRAAARALGQSLSDPSADVRMAAALAVAACGTRDSAPALLRALRDDEPLVAQAANVALENLTGHFVGFNGLDSDERSRGARAWTAWLEQNNWAAVEAGLVRRLSHPDPQQAMGAVVALGHVAASPGQRALRDYVAQCLDAEDPRGDLRSLLAALRALGHARDAQSVGLLARALSENARPTAAAIRRGKMSDRQWNSPAMRLRRQLGRRSPLARRRVFLAAAAAEALGWIGTPEAQQALIDAAPAVVDFWYYTYQAGDHPWLIGCHASPVHYRILEALDAMGSRRVGALAPMLVRSLPIDVDRGLLLRRDSYETLVARVARRGGASDRLVEACLAVLNDPAAEADRDLVACVTASPPATRGAFAPEVRAAQVASVLCLDARLGPRLAAAFQRYRSGKGLAAKPNPQTQAWVCFYLARALGKVRYRGAVDVLLSALRDDPTELAEGAEAPPSAFVYRGMTPFYRAAAAYALGRIGDRRAAPALMGAVANFDNAVDVRHSAARGLAHLCGPSDMPALQRLASSYPEVATRRVLLEACARAAGRGGRSPAAMGTPAPPAKDP